MLDKISILVVDDEESLRHIVSEVLRDEGFEVTVAASGEEALEAFRRKPFPIVITDIRMEGMGGIELLREIKKIEPDTQVVIMTSHGSMDTANDAVEAGAYDYLIKPFDDLDLIAKIINNAVKRRQLNRQIRNFAEKNGQKETP